MITCEFENGNKASLRHAVVDMLIIKDNQILLVKRALHLTNPNKFALVGGFVDRGETTAQAATREALEETGYQTEVKALFRIIDNPNRAQEDRQNISFVYIMKPLKKVGVPDQEVKEANWFYLDKLPKKEEFAFDHYDSVELYLKYISEPFPLPQLG